MRQTSIRPPSADQPPQQRVSARQILRFELGPGERARRELCRAPVQQDHELGGDVLLPELLGGVDDEFEPVAEAAGIAGGEVPHCLCARQTRAVADRRRLSCRTHDAAVCPGLGVV